MSNRQQLWLIPLLSAAVAVGVLGSKARGDDWPQWLGPQRDGVWREHGILAKFPPEGPCIRWRTPIAGGYSGPAVSEGRVYVTDYVAQKKTAKGAPPRREPGIERVLCLDEPTGRILWKYEYPCLYKLGYPAGPRTTSIIAAGKVYTLGSMGNLLCLQASDGKLLWQKDFVKDLGAQVPQWGFSANPLLDGDCLICLIGGEDGVAAAFHKDTGKLLWRGAPGKEAGYSPPMIVSAGGVRQLIIWHPEAVCSLNPQTGHLYWSIPFSARTGLTIATPRLLGDRLFVTCFYNGSLMLKLDQHRPAAEIVWKSISNSEQPRLTDALHSIMCTPWIQDGYIYGVCSYGQLRCIKAENGERVWETLRATGQQQKPIERWANAFIIPHEDRFFLMNEKGELIIARLTPQGYEEISRASVIEPDNRMPGRPVVWCHPAFANRSMYVRNDHEIVCVSLMVNNSPSK